MTEYTAAVIRLENAYESMKLAKARVANEIKSRHRVEQRREIEEATRELEHEFATALALENANGLPGDVIRSDVLHTQDWTRWKKWRDLAGIEPERVSARKAKETIARENATFLWSDDYATLTVKKNSRGKTLSPELVYDMATNTKVRGGLWWPDSQDQDYDIRVMKEDEDFQFRKMVSAQIQRAIDAGDIDNPEERG